MTFGSPVIWRMCPSGHEASQCYTWCICIVCLISHFSFLIYEDLMGPPVVILAMFSNVY